MKWLFRAVLLAILIGPFVIVTRAIDHAPTVSESAPMSVEDIERIKALFKKNDPRNLRGGERREVSATARDINLGVDYAVSHIIPNAHARAQLTSGSGTFETSIPLQHSPFNGYLNITAKVVPSTPGIALDSLRIGSVTVPKRLWRWIAAKADEKLQGTAGLQELKDIIQSMSNVQIEEDHIAMTLTWKGDLAQRVEEQGRNLVLPAAERDRVIAQFGVLADELSKIDARKVSLSRALKPMLAHIDAGAGIDEIVANARAALLTLALYVAAKPDDLKRVLGDEAAAQIPRLPKVELQLQERKDLGQHFLVSAALSGTANSGIASVIGVFKEVQDSRGGSGFSFVDLTADRAGVRFAELVARDPKKLLAQVQTIAGEADFMPSIHDLPEGMQEPAFIERFKNRDSEAYAQVSAEIDKRLDRCKIFF